MNFAKIVYFKVKSNFDVYILMFLQFFIHNISLIFIDFCLKKRITKFVKNQLKYLWQY